MEFKSLIDELCLVVNTPSEHCATIYADNVIIAATPKSEMKRFDDIQSTFAIEIIGEPTRFPELISLAEEIIYHLIYQVILIARILPSN